MSTSSNDRASATRTRIYESDLTDDEWRLVQPLVEIAQTGPGPRRSVNLREVVNALLYKQRTGCQWRMLPHDLPPRSTVSGYYQRWKQSGVWDQISMQLKCREPYERKAKPAEQRQRSVGARSAISAPAAG